MFGLYTNLTFNYKLLPTVRAKIRIHNILSQHYNTVSRRKTFTRNILSSLNALTNEISSVVSDIPLYLSDPVRKTTRFAISREILLLEVIATFNMALELLITTYHAVLNTLNCLIHLISGSQIYSPTYNLFLFAICHYLGHFLIHTTYLHYIPYIWILERPFTAYESK